MASASLLKSSPVLDKSEFVKGQTLRLPSASIVRCRSTAPSSLTVRAGSYADELVKTAKIVPGIKVDKGLVPLAGSNDESWCQGLDGLASRSAAYYQQGARFAKWRTVVSIPNGPSALAVKEAAWGLARYAAISQV
ncbi:hypothetical protein POTOM_033433 [Populus tomentosa]|uniref:Fructose-bisphosphate aldolase n=1 Tax=Populus tomentosa TaxID=118781 RepID=A0A8X7Z1X3_POPTO|nr:hypothetical protein POTOM_034822 [Populus tomentosa]KAG6762906.1 hypothetical protein POTOM_033433 [Populus tomentosa]